MKTLPDNPNLDHLRRQAKEHLVGLRDVRPDASLADAQASLARQYGFRTWTDLKAEADRRRGRADVADQAVARAVAACFGLGEVTGPMRSVGRPDDMGRRWCLDTDRGRWAVRTVDTWRPIVDAETDVALQHAAADAGILLPTPVRSRSGAIVETIRGHRWRAYRWIRSGPPLATPVSPEITFAVGAILATIHGLALPVSRISPPHAFGPTEEAWRALSTRAGAEGAAWAPALREAMPVLLDLGTIGEGVPTPPPVLCHNILGPAKVRLGPDRRPVVVGWEHAGGQPPSWELSDALVHWTVGPDGVHAAGTRAMLDGYRSAAGSLPTLGMATFRGAVNSWLHYAHDELAQALDARDDEDRRHAARSVRQLLAHLWSRTGFERLLDVALRS